jgi:hypothetical protein
MNDEGLRSVVAGNLLPDREHWHLSSESIELVGSFCSRLETLGVDPLELTVLEERLWDICSTEHQAGLREAYETLAKIWADRELGNSDE